MSLIQLPRPRLEALLALDLELCLRIQNQAPVSSRKFFGLVSRLGDGWWWLGVLLLLPVLHGVEALPVMAEMAAVAAVSLSLYWFLKRRTARCRPCDLVAGTEALVPALDRYSFPSGHTLHAVALTLVVVATYPSFAWILIPFTLLVATSRVVLGLHYPTDVVAGAGLGTSLALVAQLF
jgi:undecaprenyl-diphosphatase